MTDERDLDARAAARARASFRAGLELAVTPDARIHDLLEPGERLLATRRGVRLERRQSGIADAPTGDLYVTSQRLLLLGRHPVTLGLCEIEDATIIGERLVLLLRGGVAASIETGRPRLLRVQIAAARSMAMRATDPLGRGSSRLGQPSPR